MSSSSGSMSATAEVTHAAVLDALRQIRLRQFVRGRHAPLLDRLHALGLIVWTPQPLRNSQQQLTAHDQVPLVPEEIAELTDAGEATAEWLTVLSGSAEWGALAQRTLR
ncbi:hypothetical protein [Paraburkholderia sp. Ac-20347]|uniref:hypothetical protein n=1 Tax=Paraburkholderia sp. Ac-20347 TaxID=2703892 RepID=UPI00198116E4|nr:hypothetical protein [Paraburkholderia sp. Ac-20347]MBN3809960.1 hypothetical protein [Paraburkholderia sp. Ac-20347]